MSFKEIMDKMKERSRNRKELIRELDEQTRIQKIVEDKQKSANERELERYLKEDREQKIKYNLEKLRKMRERDISFGHNPLNVKNITNHTDWEVLKEKNLFAKNSLILNSNPKLLKNSKWLIK